MKELSIYVVLVFLMSSCYSQNKTKCSIKEVSCYNLLDIKNKEGLLESKLFYREDNQLFKIQYFDSLGIAGDIVFFEYDDEDRCILRFTRINGVYGDTLKASFDSEGEMIQLRQTTFRNFDVRQSKFIEMRFNDCNEPIEIIRYQEPLKDNVISKYRYEYEYW